jgi:hypothetical protein
MTCKMSDKFLIFSVLLLAMADNCVPCAWGDVGAGPLPGLNTTERLPPAAVTGAPAPPQAQSLLPLAVQAIEARDSISTRVRYEAYLFDKHMIGSGSYQEQHRDGKNLLRLELRTQLGDRLSSLVQVCDGRYLWTYRNSPSETKLFQIDLARVASALKDAQNPPESRDLGILPGLGGLPKALHALEAAFDFSKIEQGRWGQRKQLVWRLTGQWKRAQLIKILPNQAATIESGQPADLSKLPEPLPDQVVVLLGQEDLFPYRFEYRRELTEKPSNPNEPTSRPLVTMDLYEVSFNVPIDATQFIYNPAGLQPIDQTQRYLDSLGGK